MISSVTKFGLFVLLRQFEVDGLLRVDQLGGDRFDFDEENLRLVGRKSGMAYEIGEPIRVVVARADVEAGQIDFVLPEEMNKNVGHVHVDKQTREVPKRRPFKDDSRGARKSRFPRARRPR